MSPFCFQPEDISHMFSGITVEPELYAHCLQINVVQHFNNKIIVLGLRSAGVWCHAVRWIGPSTNSHIPEDDNLQCSTVTTASTSNLIILPKYTTNISTTTLADKQIRLWDRSKTLTAVSLKIWISCTMTPCCSASSSWHYVWSHWLHLQVTAVQIAHSSWTAWHWRQKQRSFRMSETTHPPATPSYVREDSNLYWYYCENIKSYSINNINVTMSNV